MSQYLYQCTVYLGLCFLRVEIGAGSMGEVAGPRRPQIYLCVVTIPRVVGEARPAALSSLRGESNVLLQITVDYGML